ncbi:hypothetical protein GCM10017673_18310 [Streptosporangium violaceochromogenes]|nr:hypothetical protein GCM10017673_18310 [Streptosporangium violaceochromogenes]
MLPWEKGRLRQLLSLFIVATGLISGCGESDSRGDMGSQRALIKSYVHALNSKDSDTLAKLAPPGYQTDREVAERMTAHGGKEINIKSIDITTDFGPEYPTAKVTGTSRTGPYRESLRLIQIEDRWYIIGLGHNTAPPPSGTAGTDRPF